MSPKKHSAKKQAASSSAPAAEKAETEQPATSPGETASTTNQTTATPALTGTGTLSTGPAVPGATPKEYLFKILVVGDLGTGKTSVIKRYVHNIFSMHYKSTIGVDFALKVLQYSSECVVRLQLWDIAGQERFGNMTRVYYKEAVGALVVFDVTRVSTFDGVSKWKQDLDEKVRLPDGSAIPVVLLANKVDLGKDSQVMVKNSQGQMDRFCEEKGFIGWFETSAKENLNVDQACKFLVDKILANDQMLMQKQLSSRNQQQQQGIIRPGRDENNQPKNSNCCS